MDVFPDKPEHEGMPHNGPDRRFCAMPAYLGGDYRVAGCKWYGSNLANIPKELPRSILMMTLNDADTGAPMAHMSANLLSAWRTGAIPGVGVKYLAKPDSKVIGLLGAGSIVLGISGVSYLINVWIGQNLLAGVPDFTIAYIIGLVFFLILRNTKVYDSIDTGINDKISGTATDYLVFFGIASIRLEVVAAYAGPLALMSLVGIILVTLMVYPFGKAYNKDSWFERSIFVYGYSTGVFAIGFVLLRIVDPDNKSRTVEDVALSPLTSFIEIIIWSTLPALLMAGSSLPVAGVMFAALAVCAVATVVTKTWLLKVPDSERKRLGVDDIETTI